MKSSNLTNSVKLKGKKPHQTKQQSKLFISDWEAKMSLQWDVLIFYLLWLLHLRKELCNQGVKSKEKVLSPSACCTCEKFPLNCLVCPYLLTTPFPSGSETPPSTPLQLTAAQLPSHWSVLQLSHSSQKTKELSCTG